MEGDHNHLDNRVDLNHDTRIFSHNLVGWDDNNLGDLSSILGIFSEVEKNNPEDKKQSKKNQKKKSRILMSQKPSKYHGSISSMIPLSQ